MTGHARASTIAGMFADDSPSRQALADLERAAGGDPLAVETAADVLGSPDLPEAFTLPWVENVGPAPARSDRRKR